MGTNDAFWANIARQHEALRSARTVDEVLAICPRIPGTSAGDGFFEGGGGALSMWWALFDAGWRNAYSSVRSYWVMRAPNGDLLTYIEGDLYRGDKITRVMELER